MKFDKVCKALDEANIPYGIIRVDGIRFIYMNGETYLLCDPEDYYEVEESNDVWMVRSEDMTFVKIDLDVFLYNETLCY